MPKLNNIAQKLESILSISSRVVSNSNMHYLLLSTLLLIGLSATSLKAQETTPTESPAPTSTTQPDVAATTQTGSLFSIEGGKKLMAEADQAVNEQQYDVAAQKLQSARQVFNQLSNFYLQLYNSFSGLDNAVAESHRQKALESGIERDMATYQLALVHRAQEKPELSIPLLVQIVTSQSPTSGLGKKAYEQLLDIGFVDAPISPAQQTQPPATEVPTPTTPSPEAPTNVPTSPPTTPEVPSTTP
ncbi:MAG: hypothetical protein ACRC8K_00830 [Waterburya sp.]